MRSLEHMHGNAVFDPYPCPTVLLDTEFTIRAANKAHLAVTGRCEEELVNVNIFEAFPDNPDDPECDRSSQLARSLQRVLRSGRPHNLRVIRYDIPDPADGGFLERYWSPVTTPIFEDGRVVGVLHRAEDVTPLHEDLRRVLEQYRDIMNAEPMSDSHVRRLAEAARAFVASVKDHLGLVEEVMNLRRALTSRASIDQAKGIVMAERRCSPDEAFKVLVKMSQDTNVRLADVARALVYKAQGQLDHREAASASNAS